MDLKDNSKVAGWFIGPRGENLGEIIEIIISVLKKMVGSRELLFPNDPNYILPRIKLSNGYKHSIDSLKEQTNTLLEFLSKHSLPTQSLRYQGHMIWDITIPALVGYFAAMLQNQNNVTPEASPATTRLEVEVCNDIAKMVGFSPKPLQWNNTSDPVNTIHAWAHISCDGTVANIESLWAARELKFLPLGIKHALKNEQPFKSIADSLTLYPQIQDENRDQNKLLKDATAWELLNLKQDDTLALPKRIFDLIQDKEENKIKNLSGVWKKLTSRYSLNARGISFFNSEFLQDENIHTPALIVPSNKHYSWPKAASILGMGNGGDNLKEGSSPNIDSLKDQGLINVYVDPQGKIKIEQLESVLNTCQKIKKPIVMVVGVVGTTEEGAVDPLEMIIAGRDEFRQDKENPFEYSIHADAAWGGYFLACCRNAFEMEKYPEKHTSSEPSMNQTEKNGSTNDLEMERRSDSKTCPDESQDIFDNSESWFRDSVYKSMVQICKCDSVTIDPHKMGYVPYPVGSLIYRNDQITHLLTFTAPYIGSGNFDDRSIGRCGIEGSKAGAAAASVYLSHQVIRPDKRGYGQIINQSMLNSKFFYLYLHFLKDRYKDNKFDIVMLEKLPEDLDTEAMKKKISNKLWHEGLSNGSDTISYITLFKKIAGDQNIIDYIFIDTHDRSPDRTIALNNAIYKKLRLSYGETVKEDAIFISFTTFHRNDYGDEFMNALGERLYEKPEIFETQNEIPCCRSVIMNPWAIYTRHGRKGKILNFFTEIFLPKLNGVVNELCEKTTEELKKMAAGS